MKITTYFFLSFLSLPKRRKVIFSQLFLFSLSSSTQHSLHCWYRFPLHPTPVLFFTPLISCSCHQPFISRSIYFLCLPTFCKSTLSYTDLSLTSNLPLVFLLRPHLSASAYKGKRQYSKPSAVENEENKTQRQAIKLRKANENQYAG